MAPRAGRFPASLFWADSRRRIGLSRNVIIKVNAREAVLEILGPSAAGEEDAVVKQATRKLRSRTGKPVVVTAGDRGIWVSDPCPVLVPAVRVESR